MVMKYKFDVGKLSYVIKFTYKNEFKFYVDVLESEYNPYVMSDFELGFGDEPPLEIYTKVDSKNVFAVKRHVEDFIGKALKRYKPYYFHYYANEDHKRSAYYKFGLYIAKKYGYTMYVDDVGSKYTFMKNPDND